MPIPSSSCGGGSPVAMFPFWTGHFSRSVGMNCDVWEHITFHQAPITNTSFTEASEMCAAYLLSTLEISYINTLFLHSLWCSVDYLKCNAGFLSVFHKDGSLFLFSGSELISLKPTVITTSIFSWHSLPFSVSAKEGSYNIFSEKIYWDKYPRATTTSASSLNFCISNLHWAVQRVVRKREGK